MSDYKINQRTGVVHRPTCALFAGVRWENKRDWDPAKAALTPGVIACPACLPDGLPASEQTPQAERVGEEGGTVRVGFRYQDGEVLTPEREALSEEIELPVTVIDLGDGEWLTLADLRDLHAERLERDLAAWETQPTPSEGGPR